MFQHSWKITVPLTIVIVVGLGITGYALSNQNNCKFRFFVEFQDLKIETESNTEECN